MRNDYYTNSKDYINRWVVSYADLVTMLLALFVFLYAVSQIDNHRLKDIQARIEKSFAQSNVTKYQEKIQENLSSVVNQKVSYNSVDSADKMEKMLKQNSVLESKSLKFIKDKRGLTIRVNNSMLFDEGSAIIKPQAKQTLTKIMNVLTKMDNPVIIEGHTDSKPIKNAKFPSNWELSTARATNIISFMLKSGKISPKRICAVGYGEYMPIAENTSISGRMLNRRVDIIILDKSNKK